MTGKKQHYYTAIAVVALIIILVLAFKTKHSAPENSEQKTPEQTAAEAMQKNNATMDSGAWAGKLTNSDNAKKGNLMLVTKDHTIYLQTSRDFSALIGKEVTVSYKGTVNNFILDSISAQQCF